MRSSRTCISHSLPNARAGRRHVEALDPERAQRIDNGVDDCRQRSDRAGFTGALRTERVPLGRHRVRGYLHVRHRVGPRHAIIHEASRQVLTQLAVVDNLLHQRLAESLRDPTVDLAFQANWVHHCADIVDHDVADDLDRTGIGVDLDLANVAAIGIGVVVGGEGSRLVEPAFEAKREAAGLERGLGNIGDANASVGAGDREVAVGEFDVDVGRFEQMRCNAFALGDDLVGSHPQGRATNHRRA